MDKIIGNTTATPMVVPDLAQTDPKKADFIKNKPEIYTQEEADQRYASKADIGNIESVLYLCYSPLHKLFVHFPL